MAVLVPAKGEIYRENSTGILYVVFWSKHGIVKYAPAENTVRRGKGLEFTATWEYFLANFTRIDMVVDGGTLNTLGGTFSLAENSTTGTVAGAITGRTTGSTLSLTDDAGGRFAISGTNIVATSTPTDYETATSHSITVRETLAGATNTPRDTVFTVTVTDVVEATTPVITSVNAFSTPENVLYNQTATASGGGTMTWAKGGTDAAVVTLNTATGAWSLTGDFETDPSITFTLTATNSAGSSAPQAVTVTVTDVAEGGGGGGPTLTWTSGTATYDPVFNLTPIEVGDVVVLQVDDNIDFLSLYGTDTNTVDVNEASEGNLSFAGIPTLDYGTTYYAKASKDNGVTWSNIVSKAMDAGDGVPNVFTFTDVIDTAQSTEYTSNAITVAGLSPAFATAVSVSGGEYSKNGAAYTSTAGTVVNGDTVAVRHTTSASLNTATNTTLTIGGVSDTYTTTTIVAPSVVATHRSSQTVEFGYSSAPQTLAPITISSGDKVVIKLNSRYSPSGNVTGITANGGAITFTRIARSSAVDNFFMSDSFYADTAGVTSLELTVTMTGGPYTCGVHVVSLTGAAAGGPTSSYAARLGFLNEADHDIDGGLTTPAYGVMLLMLAQQETTQTETLTGATEIGSTTNGPNNVTSLIAKQTTAGNVTVDGGGDGLNNIDVVVANSTWTPA